MENIVLGELVSLKNHPYFSENDDIIISADEKHIPPVMVVIETLYDFNTKTQYEEKTGIEQINQSQVKCIFYSHKQNKFESNWFHIGQLKKIITGSSDNQQININELKDLNQVINLNVILKSWKIELQKQKSSLSYASTSNEKTKKITSLLTFLPPVMTIIGIKKIDDVKENNFDKKTGKSKRNFSKLLLKCKWYNSNLDNFSEEFISPDSLEFVKSIDEELIMFVKENIENKRFLKFTNKNLFLNGGNTIGKPIKITYNHCFYYLDYYDYITNRSETVNLNDFVIKDFKEKEKFATVFAPKYNEIQVDLDIEEFLNIEFPKINSKSNKTLRITYTNVMEITSTRTLLNSELYFNGDTKDFKKPDAYEKKYIHAKCCNSNGELRYFKFDRIKKIEVLDL